MRVSCDFNDTVSLILTVLLNDEFSMHLKVSIELLLESRLELRSIFLTRINVERGGVKNVRL